MKIIRNFRPICRIRPSLLSSALMWERYRTFSTLLECGADVNQADRNGVPPLMYAAGKDDLSFAKALLARHANVNARDKMGYTALIYACEDKGSPEMVQMLLDAGADVNMKAQDGRTALKYARSWDNARVVERLKRAGAK